MTKPEAGLGTALAVAGYNAQPGYELPIGESTSAYLPIVARNNLNTAFFVQNIGDAMATITVGFYDPDGARVHSVTDTIPPHGSLAYGQAMMDELPSGFEGGAVISSDHPILAVANVRSSDADSLLSYNGVQTGAMKVILTDIMHNWYGYNTRFWVQNAGTSPANLSMTYYPGEWGGQQTGAAGVTQSATIKPGASIPFDQTGMTMLGATSGPYKNRFLGSVRVESTNGQPVVVVVEVWRSGTAWAAAYNGIADADSSVLAPRQQKEVDGWSSSAHIMNVGTADATVFAEFYSSDGSPVLTVTNMVPPGRDVVHYLPTHPDIPAGFDGALEVAANQPLAVLANWFNPILAGDGMAMNLGIGRSQLTHQAHLPRVAHLVAEGESTQFSIQNVAEVTATVTISFYHEIGGATAVVTDVIPGHGVSRYATWNVGALGEDWEGAVTIRADQPIAVEAMQFLRDRPIAGLVATNDSPTPLGQATTLTATVTAGSNVAYTWDFGDGATGSGAVVTHVYPAVGVYMAVVTASNSVSVVTATTTVTIQGPRGGPDDFGYTWEDSGPFSWIDATTGTDTGLSGSTYVAGPIPIGFTFKYYENSYAQLWVSRYGLLGFDADLWSSSGNIPSPGRPNDIIAAYWTYITMDADSKVYYLAGGSPPNRYFVVQWHQVHDGYTDNTFTFQAVLRENGDILLQYHTMNYGSSGYYCARVGIEDSLGSDGLRYWRCGSISSNKGVRFYRPAPAARLKVWPLHQGHFTRAGVTEAFYIPIRNTGELGADTYDLTISSTWPASLYAADGTTPLTDTDGDSILDTGSVTRGGAVTVTVKVRTPSLGNLGDANAATVTIRSSLNTGKRKTVTLQTAIPASFAQVYSDSADGAMSLYLVQPAGQGLRNATANNYHGFNMAVAEMASGNFVYVWSKGRCLDSVCNIYVSEIEYAVLDQYGETMRGARKLTNHSGATLSAYDYPAVAVAPNGHIGVMWYRYLWDRSISKFNYNIYFAVLDAAGNVLVPPINLTNNAAWGTWSDLNVPRFYSPHIAATGDNHFILGWQWQREHLATPSDGCSQYCYVDDIYYAVRDAAGAEVKPITQFTSDTPGWDEAYRYPNLTQLSNDRVLLVWHRSSDGNIYYAVLDSAGDTVKVATNLFPGFDWGGGADAAELSNGNIVVAWRGEPGRNLGEAAWTARYYNNETLTEPAALVRTDETIDFRWDLGSPGPGVNPDHFSVRWTGTINVAPGAYEFTMGSDDGSRLWIDDRLIMDHWDECCTHWRATVTLAGGAHQIRMEMRERSGAAWASLTWEAVETNGAIRYTVLDSTYNPVAGPTVLDNPAGVTGDAYVSVAADNAGHAILTWMDYDWSYRPNLYYALVDSSGNVVTPPLIFRTSQEASLYIETSFEGYGNTSYSWTPPAGTDAVVAFGASLFGGPPGGNAAVGVRYTNHGAARATGIVLTATLDSNLTYVSDTSGVASTVSGNDVVWSLPDLGLLDSRDFILYVQVPSGATHGSRYPVTLTLTSAGPEANPADNTAVAEVMVARQVFLPIITKSY